MEIELELELIGRKKMNEEKYVNENTHFLPSAIWHNRNTSGPLRSV